MTRFVRAGVAMGFVLALLVAAVVRASDAPTGAPSFDPQSNRFTLAVIPDTQYLLDDDRGDSEPVTDALKWMVANRATPEHRVRRRPRRRHAGRAAERGRPRRRGLQDPRPREAARTASSRATTTSTRARTTRARRRRSRRPSARTATPTTRRTSARRPTATTARTCSPAAGASGSCSRSTGASARPASPGRSRSSTPTRPSRRSSPPTRRSRATPPAPRASRPTAPQLWNNLIRKNDQIILSLSGHNWPVGRTTPEERLRPRRLPQPGRLPGHVLRRRGHDPHLRVRPRSQHDRRLDLLAVGHGPDGGRPELATSARCSSAPTRRVALQPHGRLRGARAAPGPKARAHRGRDRRAEDPRHRRPLAPVRHGHRDQASTTSRATATT